MKKKTNKILFIGLAVIIVATVISLAIDVRCTKNPDEQEADTTPDNIITDVRDLEPFNKIVNSASVKINYVQDEKSQVVVTASERTINNVLTYVNDHELVIESWGMFQDAECEITIYSPNCTEIKNAGVGLITCDSISGTKLKIENEGVGDIAIMKVNVSKLKVENDGMGAIGIDGIAADFVEAENDGVGNITLSGKVNELRLSNEGVGQINAQNVECDKVSIDSDESKNIIIAQ